MLCKGKGRYGNTRQCPIVTITITSIHFIIKHINLKHSPSYNQWLMASIALMQFMSALSVSCQWLAISTRKKLNQEDLEVKALKHMHMYVQLGCANNFKLVKVLFEAWLTIYNLPTRRSYYMGKLVEFW